MTSNAAETQFMSDLLAGLDESHFSIPPSQSPPRTRKPLSPTQRTRCSPSASQSFASASAQLNPAVSDFGVKQEFNDVEFDNLLDWSHFPAFTPPIAKRTDERQLSTASQKKPKREHSSPPHSGPIPSDPVPAPSIVSADRTRSHRAYTRCSVVSVLDRTYSAVSVKGTRPAPEKALLLRVESQQTPVSRPGARPSGDQSQFEAPAPTIMALLRDEWNQTHVGCDDVVHIIGSFEAEMHALPDEFYAASSKSLASPQTPRLEVDIHLPRATQKPSVHGTDPDEDLWMDMASLPSLSQGASQGPSGTTHPTSFIKTMILGSRSYASNDTDHQISVSQQTDSRDNLLIVHPDVLVPATKVADVASCIRKPVIQDRLRGVSDLSVPLIMGNMLHEVLQACLTGHDQTNASSDRLHVSVKTEYDSMATSWPETWIGIGNFSRHFVEQQIKAQVHANIESLYAVDMDLSEAAERLTEKAAPFARFALVFLARHDDTFHPDAKMKDSRALNGTGGRTLPKVRLTRILDVEEEIWSPMYGLKGKVDVSVECEILESHLPTEATVFQRAGAAQQSHEPSICKWVLPLELKTGRAEVVSTEHRAQTMLYTLMMSDRYGTSVKDGLLYYSKSGDLHRISRSRNEIRSLVIGRNELAHYLRHDVKRLEQHGHADTAVRTLPSTIDNEHKCGRCYAVDGCMLYRSAVETISEPKIEKVNSPVSDIEGHFAPRLLPTRSAIADLFDSKTGHLSQAHLSFFRKWERLLSLEEDDAVRIRREMWNMKAEDRERLGRCFANMRLEVSPEDSKAFVKGETDGPTLDMSALLPQSAQLTKEMHKVTRRFVRHVGASGDDNNLSGHMSINDPVTISIEPAMLSVAQGFITKLTTTAIEVGIDHDLQASLQRTWDEHGIYPSLEAINNVVFRIDKDELSSGLGRVRANLANLFLTDARGGDTKRRELVVDLRPPRFLSLAELKEASGAETQSSNVIDQVYSDTSLNQDQKVAIERVLLTKDYSLILGMPGTGKTTTIAKLIQILTRMGKRILLTSYTHSAVDTILRKLAKASHDHMKILRLGNKDRIHPDAHAFVLPRCSTLEELKDAYERPNVVAATCLSIHHSFFASMLVKSRKAADLGGHSAMFDYCIVDEASQIPLPTCLGPLRFADKFVLVGDHYQLPPLVKNAQAKKGGLDVSLFKLLSDKYEQEAMVYLKSQYRMNRDIMELSNTLVYHGALSAGNDEVGRQTLPLDKIDETVSCLPRMLLDASSTQVLSQAWVRDALDPQSAVRFFDTSLLPLDSIRESKRGEIIKNKFEARAVAHLATALVLAGCRPENIAVITPYRQQIKLLQSMLHDVNPYLTQVAPRVEGMEQIELLTADQSQGRDKDVIIVTFTRASVGSTPANDGGMSSAGNGSGTGELLNDLRRLNVALTRARRKLLLVGHGRTLQGSSILRSLLTLLKDKGWVHALLSEDSAEPNATIKTETSPQSETTAKTETSLQSETTIKTEELTPPEIAIKVEDLAQSNIAIKEEESSQPETLPGTKTSSQPETRIKVEEGLTQATQPPTASVEKPTVSQRKNVQKSLHSFFKPPSSDKTRPALHDVQLQRDPNSIKARKLH